MLAPHSYRDHWSALQRELALSVLSGPEPDGLAFFEAAGCVAHQLAIIEAMTEAQYGDLRPLYAAVREPWVLGYLFGAGASRVEARLTDRRSPEATSVIVTLHQVVLGGATYEECLAISGQASRHPDFATGMEAGGVDGDAIGAGGGSVALANWLRHRLQLAPGVPVPVPPDSGLPEAPSPSARPPFGGRPSWLARTLGSWRR
jgi:hypothetical protein